MFGLPASANHLVPSRYDAGKAARSTTRNSMNVYVVTLRTTKSSEVKTVTVQANTEAGAMSKAVAQHPGWMVSGTPKVIG